MRLILTLAMLFIYSSAFAQMNVYVSIIPQKTFVEAIGKDKVNVNVMVMPGASPATYEPKPKQMVQLSSTPVYFAVGAPFESTWLEKFAAMNPQMDIIHTDAGIKKRNVEKHVHDHESDHDGEHEHEGEHGHHHEDGIKDPHVWLDPILVIKQAESITEGLCRHDAENCAFYTRNKKDFIRDTEILNGKIEEIFKGKADMHFMVFHPSWGYFADRYGLNQIPVELEGKEPKPSELLEFINMVKEMKLKTIFIQPQFSKKAANLIAHETGASVVAVDPLAANWGENLIYAAHLIAGTSQPKK